MQFTFFYEFVTKNILRLPTAAFFRDVRCL